MRVHDAVITTLGRKELIAPRENKILRRNGARGVISGVLGRKDFLFLVLHEGATTPAVYYQEELELEPNVYWTVTYMHHGLAYFIELPTYRDVREQIDELTEDDAVSDVTVEGPVFSDKELTEGFLPTIGLFDRLKKSEDT